MTEESAESLKTELEIAQARRAAYTLISCGFQYPDRKLVDSLSDPLRWSTWPEILSRCAPETEKPLTAIRAALRVGSNRSTGDTSMEVSSRQEAYYRLFGHAVRGRCPPYELEYGRSEIIHLASVLADVAGFYAAFGREIGDHAEDRADHLTIESEFMALLYEKEAYAIAQADPDHQDISVRAQRDFLKDHLARWLPAFTHRVQQVDPQCFYGLLSRFASAFVSAECRRFEITAGPVTLEIKPADPVLDRAIACELEEGEVQAPGQPFVQLAVDSGGTREE